jgi:hypothetical protein
MCTHVCQWKIIPVETTPEIGGGENKGEQYMGWIHVWYSWYIGRTCVNVTIYPHPAQQKRKKRWKINKRGS